MRSMPHKPQVSCFEPMMKQAVHLIERGNGMKEAAYFRKHARFFRDQAEYRFVRAMIDYLWERPMEQVIASVREGLDELYTAFELGYRTHAWEMWDFFLYAQAVDDQPTAEFLCGLPEALWSSNRAKPVPWLVTQVRALFALSAGKDEEAAAHLGETRQLTGAGRLPPELEEDRPSLENVIELLQDLLRRDAASFNAHLASRTEIRARSFGLRNTSAAIALLDLHGLGLSRLARRRGMTVTVRHVYLPLDMLDGPAAQPRP